MEDIVRPELNLEKWPSIWQPAKSNSKLSEINLERKKIDGSISKIEITANSKYGALTTETQKIMYALYKISEDKKHPRRIYFSANKIVKIIKKKWGTSAAEIVELGLYQLRSTFFVLRDVFYDSVSKKVITVIDTFTILSVLKMTKEDTDGHTTKEACYCEFNDYIYNNLKNNYVRPILLDVFLSFGDDGIAQLIYSHLDLMLSKSNEYRRLIKNVFQDINLVGREYKKVSIRKRTLERVKEKLEGKKLSSGGVLRLRLEEALKDRDYELVATKELNLTEVSEQTNVAYEKQPLEEGKRQIEKLAKATVCEPKKANKTNNESSGNGSTKELVQLFHKKFFNLENVKVSSRELAQAKELIKDYGLDISKYLIDYAYKQAKETNYKVGQFGAVLEYAGRGAAQYEKDAKRRENIEKLETCEYCNGLIFVDVVIVENNKERSSKFKCPHDLEKLEITAKEKNIAFRLANGRMVYSQE